MVYTTKKCPYCKHVYQNRATSNYVEGSPFVKCGCCGQTFVDKDRVEIALKPYDEEQFKKSKCFLSAIWPFGIMAIIMVPIGIAISNIFVFILGLIGIIGYFGLAIYYIKQIPIEKARYKKNYEESLMRLMEKEYILALIDIGYYVPPWFLEKYYDIKE